MEKKVKDWVGQCLRKKSMTEEHADYTIKVAKKLGNALYKYFCPHCQRFHVTKQAQKDFRK